MFLKYLHLFILIAFISSCASSDDEKPQTALQDANAGIFSQIQIQNGQQLFNLHCVACHGNDLRGTEGGTALMGDHFLEKWKDSTLAQLFQWPKTMPKANRAHWMIHPMPHWSHSYLVQMVSVGWCQAALWSWIPKALQTWHASSGDPCQSSI